MRTLTCTLIALLSAALWAANAVPPATDYGCWRGPLGNGSAAPSGKTLLSDISQAKLIWKSDYIPGVYGAFVHTGNNGCVVAEGKLVVIYHEPNPEAWDEAKVAATKLAKWKPGGYSLDPYYDEAVKDPTKMDDYLKKRYAITADDVVQCLDAATGKTLWRFVKPTCVFNEMGASKRGTTTAKYAGHTIPLIHQGKVYAVGGSHHLRCFDAATGALVWEVPLAGVAGMRKVIEAARQAKSILNLPKGIAAPGVFCNLVMADGVLVVKYSGSLLGVDPATGTTEWTVNGCFTGGRNNLGPLVWQAGNRALIITATNCVDPATGKVLWTLPEPMVDTAGPGALDGDLLVTPVGKTKVAALAAYRLTVDAATPVWKTELPEGYVGGPTNHAGVTICEGLALIKAERAAGATPYFVIVDVATGKFLAGIGGARSPQNATVGGDGRFFAEVSRDTDSGIAMMLADAGKFGTETAISYREASKNKLSLPGYAMSTAPVYCDGRLYVRMQDGFRCYDVTQP